MTATRRKLTTLDKLKILVAQARCPLCGERLGDLSGLDFDHVQALARGGSDTLDNIRATHTACHRVKTSGTAATSLGSDVHEIAKTKRLEREAAEFRARLLAKADGMEQPPARKRKAKIPSRPMRRKQNHE